MHTAISRATSRPGRFGGLDGLRAIAVALVLGYHLFPSALPGGFLGVDVFFAISGFLITSLLLREAATGGGIRLGAFWRRRARRLLPALALVLLVCSSLALLVGGDLLVRIGSQIAGTTFFVSNWVFIANGADYFARDTPELFRNTWSLSIEEQFYILLPLLVLALLRLRGRSSRAIPLVVLGLASAAWMAELSLSGADPTRIYFGSDTHTFGLLLGAAMAMLLAPRSRPGDAAASEVHVPGVAKQLGFAAVAAVGLGVLGWLTLTLPEGSPQSFEGGFQLAILASLAVVWAVTRPGLVLGVVLDVAPLRWVGERSYGIYLWHWPLLLILTAVFGPSSPSWVVPAVTVAATFAAAALSYRFIEQPVRRFGLRRSLKLLVRPGNYTPRQRLVAIGLGSVLVVTIPASAAAVVTAPTQSSAADAIARGQEALDRADGSAGSGAADGSGSNADTGSKQESNGKRESGEKESDKKEFGKKQASKKPSAPPRELLPEGPELSAVGDSVMLASLPELEEAFPGIFVDAAVSRGMGVGVELTTEWAATGELRQVLVVGLGTNGPIESEQLTEIHQIAGDRPLVLVNAHAEREWIPGVNEALTEFADSHRGVVVADWSGTVAGVPDALAGDDIHPNPSGGEIYAAAVRDALEALQQPGEALGFALPRL